MSSDSTLLLSIRPEHADRIFRGEKTVELRRIRPRRERGDVVFVYVTAPVMALAGAFQVSGVHAESPEKLWLRVGATSGLTRTEFHSYFKGCNKAYGIGIEKAWRYTRPVALEKLRERVPGFLPPQSYWYLPVDTARILKSGCRVFSAEIASLHE